MLYYINTYIVIHAWQLASKNPTPSATHLGQQTYCSVLDIFAGHMRKHLGIEAQPSGNSEKKTASKLP